MRKEIIHSLEREKKISQLAIAHLKDQLKSYERKFRWSTAEFLEKFDNGSIGDDEAFFKWYALAQALKDWQSTKEALEEAIVS
ncbi:MAG: hypothetical protein ONB16_08595 [candidate division KSB1 bacterium]|nr:hypothetical protein [candidate division KSB1 bacterium]